MRMWQHGAWGDGAQLEASACLCTMCLCSADRALFSAQVQQARAEARAEAEAAAEQRSAAALAHERAELAKQARCLLCMCGNGEPAALPWPAHARCVCGRLRMRPLYMPCGSMGHVMAEVSCAACKPTAPHVVVMV